MSECVNLGLTSTRRDLGSNLARMTGTAVDRCCGPSIGSPACYPLQSCRSPDK